MPSATSSKLRGAVPNIPAKSNRKWRLCLSRTICRERNQVGRCPSKLRHFRRIPARYEKLADNFRAMVKRDPMHLWLRAYETTASPNRPKLELAAELPSWHCGSLIGDHILSRRPLNLLLAYHSDACESACIRLR